MAPSYHYLLSVTGTPHTGAVSFSNTYGGRLMLYRHKQAAIDAFNRTWCFGGSVTLYQARVMRVDDFDGDANVVGFLRNDAQ